MAANLKETTAIIRENAADHALRPLFMRFEWTRCKGDSVKFDTAVTAIYMNPGRFGPFFLRSGRSFRSRFVSTKVFFLNKLDNVIYVSGNRDYLGLIDPVITNPRASTTSSRSDTKAKVGNDQEMAQSERNSFYFN